ncbi:hypothetical protein DL546_007168 [Coniochaeta pulveracea]|uniref:Uncharacterized protein n=1 Tax=Coniochaeta pulveracea TaxID=177199 RepID=A0A420YJH6_9PEZI|nr:hypothetical protein DL546_007168 [Coniochaeta pulveracea]
MKRPEDFQAPTSQISHRATPLACRVDANCLGPQSPVSHASPTSFGPQAYFRVLRRAAITSWDYDFGGVDEESVSFRQWSRFAPVPHRPLK